MVYNPVSQAALGDAKYLMTPHLETINTFESVRLLGKGYTENLMKGINKL